MWSLSFSVITRSVSIFLDVWTERKSNSTCKHVSTPVSNIYPVWILVNPCVDGPWWGDHRDVLVVGIWALLEKLSDLANRKVPYMYLEILSVLNVVGGIGYPTPDVAISVKEAPQTHRMTAILSKKYWMSLRQCWVLMLKPMKWLLHMCNAFQNEFVIYLLDAEASSRDIGPTRSYHSDTSNQNREENTINNQYQHTLLGY